MPSGSNQPRAVFRNASSSQLTSAEQMSQQLRNQLAEGDNIFRRLSKIAIAARPVIDTAPPPRASSAKAVAAAAQAFSDRRKSDGLAA